MDIRDYEYIVAIAEQGSITRAAAQLFITQPALTRFLQRTEASLGLALFSRSGNRFLLTEAGRKYIETGQIILRLDRQLMEELAAEVRVQKNRIRLGIPMGRSRDIVKNILPAFYKKYPDIRLYVRADTSRHNMQGLHNRQQDLVLVTNVERSPGYTYLPVETSSLAVAVSADCPLLSESREEDGLPFPVIAPESLKNYPLISLPATTNSGNLARELFKKYSLEGKVILELSDVRSVMDAVEQGLGVSLFMSVPTGSRRVRYLSIRGLQVPEQTAMLVYPSDKNLSPAMQYLIDLLQETAADS